MRRSHAHHRRLLALATGLIVAGLLAGGCPQSAAPAGTEGGAGPATGDSAPSGVPGGADEEQSGQSAPGGGGVETPGSAETPAPSPPASPGEPSPEPPAPPGGTDAHLVVGPGFTLTIPPGFELIQDSSPHPAYSFWHAYAGVWSDTTIGVGVLSASPGATSSYEDYTLRVKGAVMTGSGDFLLIVRAMTDRFFGQEVEGALGMLADGSGLVVLLGSPTFTGDDELTAQALFSSIDLEDTDGLELEDAWRETAPRVRIMTDNDLVMLDDTSVWVLPESADYDDQAELRSWNVGDAVFPQRVTEFLLDHDELVHVGHWRPVTMEYLGFADGATIVAVVDATTIQLSDGSLWGFTWSVPAGWEVGDTVFRVDAQFYGQWLIHEKTNTAVLFY